MKSHIWAWQKLKQAGFIYLFLGLGEIWGEGLKADDWLKGNIGRRGKSLCIYAVASLFIY